VAEKKGDTRAARRVSEQIAAESVSASDRVAPQPDDGRVVDAHPAEDLAIRDGADLQRVVTQVLQQFLAAGRDERNSDRERMGRIETTLTGLGSRFAGLASQFHETAAAPSTAPEPAPAEPTPTARLVSDTRSFYVHGWRQSLWISETNQSKPLPKPRTTIVGRALSDLGATSRGCDAVTIVQVFRLIHASGQHHLDQGPVWNLESADSSVRAERNGATSGLNKVFKKRFNQLKKAQLANEDAERRWLTGIGKDVFDGWPDWQVEHDDEDCEGKASLARRRPEATDESAAAAPEGPAAESAEGGSASAASE
jgi:hypothetical protein